MNELFINKIRTRLARATACTLIVFAATLAVSGLMAQSTTPVTDEFKEKAKVAFTAALTRSARDPAFRAQLVKDAESAKRAVEEEGKIKLPPAWVIIFYEAESRAIAESTMPEAVAKFLGSRSNENYHVFYLPPPDGKQHEYEEHLMCCYKPWRPPTPPPQP
jgi:hypothetical protein